MTEKENRDAAGDEGEALTSVPQQADENEPAQSESADTTGAGEVDDADASGASGASGVKRIVDVEGEKKVVTSDGEGHNWENERQYFRVFFPDAETPVVTVDGIDYDVVDASEKGIKFKKPEGECPFEVDQPISCKFTLKTGDSCFVKGKVLRILPSVVILLLTEGIPFRLLMSEQRRFISIYKHIYVE